METHNNPPLPSLAFIYSSTLETDCILTATQFYFHPRIPSPRGGLELEHYPQQDRSYNHTASMTSIALNPSAPSFIPSHRNTVPSVPLLISPDQNPNPYLSYYLSPFYLQIPPQYISYQYFSFPSYCATFQLISPPCAPALPPSVPRCSIKELDENLGPEISSADHEMVEPKPMANSSVVNCRRTWSRMSELTVMRAPRCQEVRRRSSVKVSHRKYQISKDADFEMGSKTTLMIKNIPAKFRKGSLLAILRNHCIEENKKARALEGDEAVLSEFDFLYLPIDFRSNNNFGYAFVNFTSPVGARRLFKSLHNHRWIFAESNKVCQLNFARIQGLVESIEHADQMVFNRGVPDMFLPVHYEPPYNGLNESIEYIHGQKIM